MHDPNDFENSDLTSRKITNDIVSQSLDFKDWLDQIQSEETRPKTRTALDKSSYSRSTVLPTWMTALVRWFRRLLRLMRKRQFIEFLSIEQFPHQLPELFWGGNCDSPKKNTTLKGTTLPIWGWIIGRNHPVTAIRFVVNQSVLEEIPVNTPRPDVNKVYPFLPPESFGYYYQLPIKEFPDRGSLKFEAVFADGTVETIALIKFYRY